MKLSVKNQYKLHKDYKGVTRVVVFTGDNENTLEFFDPNDLIVGKTETGLYTLKEYMDNIQDQIKELNRKLDDVIAINKKQDETIKNILQIKGE